MHTIQSKASFMCVFNVLVRNSIAPPAFKFQRSYIEKPFRVDKPFATHSLTSFGLSLFSKQITKKVLTTWNIMAILPPNMLLYLSISLLFPLKWIKLEFKAQMKRYRTNTTLKLIEVQGRCVSSCMIIYYFWTTD